MSFVLPMAALYTSLRERGWTEKEAADAVQSVSTATATLPRKAPPAPHRPLRVALAADAVTVAVEVVDIDTDDGHSVADVTAVEVV